MVTIDDRTEYIISNWDEFDAFMKRLNEINVAGSTERPQAVITADITMPEDASLTLCKGEFNGTLDGQGHTIKGLRLGAINDTGTAYYQDEPALFNRIGSSGCVKNLIVEDFRAYYGFIRSDGGQSTSSDEVPVAMITQENKGTISGLVLRDCLLYSCIQHNYGNEQRPILAGLAVSNHGTVEACQIIGLKLYADRDKTDPNTVGCAGVFNNESGGIMKGCYVEGLKLWNSLRADYLDAAIDIITMGRGGTMQGNYFRVPASVSASSTNAGTNVLTITEIQDDRAKQEAELNKPAFAANLAWHMNKEAGPLWGVPQVLESSAAGNEGNDEMITPLIFPLDLQMEDVKAPVRAAFEVGTVKKNLYLYPDQYKLPGEESFGADTPAWWQSGDLAYAPDFGPIEISKDVTFTGVQNLTDCVAKLTVPETGTTCYKNLKDALTAAASCEAEGAKLDITADCSMDSGTFTVNENVTMTICDGAALTMKKSAQINNKGRLVSAEGSILHKYGTIVNTGTIEVNGDFYNYGTRLKNTDPGTIEHRTDIKCQPHCLGEWQIADAPNEDGSWTKTAVCEVCTNTITKTIAPNPPVEEIDSIEVFRAPDTKEYVINQTFSSEGMVVAAKLKDGGKAVITQYDMVITEGDPELTKPIQTGDMLEEQGTWPITVSYQGLTCEFQIRVLSAITSLTIAEGPRDVVRGGTLQLTPYVMPVGAPAKISWKSSQESVATVDKNGLVTGAAAGQAKITASCDDLTATCIIKVHEAAVSLELDQEEVTVPEDGTGVIAARVTPADASSEVTWSLPDTSIAGFPVTDETTGEVTLSKTTKSKLSPGGAAFASTYVTVAGISEGDAVITVTVADARGYEIHKECAVQVRQAPAALHLKYQGKVVSGTTVAVDAAAGSVQFEAESSEPDDILQWTTVDDDRDPVIAVDASGKVKLIRAGTATLSVLSEKTGLTDVCLLQVVETPPQPAPPNPPTGIIVSSGGLRLAAGTVKTLTASLLPEDADGSIQWTSSDETIARVSDNGVVTGVREGKAVITLTATADESITASCLVTVLDPNLVMTLSQKEFYYNGKEQYPSVTVRSGSMILAENATKSNNDVLIIYSGGRTLPRDYNVTASVNEEGMETVADTYRISVKPTKLKKLKKGKRKFTAKWKKQGKRYITGYQIRYSLKKNMSRSKYRTIRTFKKKKLTIRNLKAKKQYYVQIRTYKTINGKNYPSEWSKIRKARTR